MAASQARLLTITNRLHDVEYKAQNIEAQKIALATQKDDLYQEYNDALDAKKIQVKFNDGATTKYVDANFSTLCSYNENRLSEYTLTDTKTGKIIVNEKTATAWNEFGCDKYSFAWAMMGLDSNYGWENSAGEYDDRKFMGAEIGIGTVQADQDMGYGKAKNGLYNLYMTDVEAIVFNKHAEENSELQKLYDLIDEADNETDQAAALRTFRDKLYKDYGSEIYEYQRLSKQGEAGENTEPSATAEIDDDREWDEISGEFNFYTRLYDAINNAGGCVTIEPQYESGDEANEWFNNMVSSGRVTISVYNTNKKSWTDTSVATSTNQNNLQETQDDTDLKKAEAKYENELSKINAKDTKFDNELSKLETERTSITTEMDSIKKVKDDNIDRTFGIFS